MRAEIKQLSQQVSVARKAGDATMADELSSRSRSLGQSVKHFAESAGSILAIHWSPDGSRLAIESQQYGNSISIWRITSGTQLYKFPTKGTVYEAVWSPDSKYMSCSQVVGSYATTLHVSILIFVA